MCLSVKHKIKRCGKTTAIGFRWKLGWLNIVADASSSDIIELGQHQTNERMTQQSQLHMTASWSRKLNVFGLLHSKPSTYYSDDDCARLLSTFSWFFINKLKCIGDTVAANLTSSSLISNHRHSQAAQWTAAQLLLPHSPRWSSATTCEDASQVIATRYRADIASEVVIRHIRYHNCSIGQSVFSWRLFPACLQGKLLRFCHYSRRLVLTRQTQQTADPISNLSTIQRCSKDWHWCSCGHISSILWISVHFNRFLYQSLYRNSTAETVKHLLSWRWPMLLSSSG